MNKRISIFMVLATVFALGLMTVAPVAFAGPKGDTETSDHDGDHDSDESTQLEDDHDTADEGDNAHPSGKDRSVENGGSGNQGKSESNPDDSKGPQRYEGGKGDDKPQGPGGTDRDDQDGNNGCGNDDDFDDDNNGWCGKPRETDTPDTDTPGGNDDDDDVEGDNEERCPGADEMEQGKSCSTPDQNGKGPERDETGTDKDEDGNNGCGNDDDRMDDNEGWCGPKDKDDDTDTPDQVLPDLTERPGKPAAPCDADATMAGVQPCTQVAPDVVTNPATPEDEVLGEIITRDNGGPAVAPAAVAPAVAAEGAALPFTGGQILSFVAAGFGLITAGGTALVIRSKK